ncbi:major facilitator superfamily domain-containing protein [Boeremia exigua]|uniref:major facilitator superfamily domain-containing protein n=1 Tax=Boeremia exigua TaxID=749465 RepID=UPI001E8E4C76|nr:major facilitator superfamily domain-containing protein [Boeremia exigua]KAH6625479.1 major facilitator superfamily domain-containing protein [Boeremia exigua]
MRDVPAATTIPLAGTADASRSIDQPDADVLVYVAVYERFSVRNKRLMTATFAYCGLLANLSTTSILAAVPEVVDTFESTPNVINISNSIYLLFMGISSLLWGPWADALGRRPVYLVSTSMFTLASLGTALSPSLPMFFVFRAVTAWQGTAFLILGSSCISDIYHPTERGTSLGWFLSGTMVGPALGPVIGGIIVTYASWRAIFWMQTALGALATIQVILVLEETLQSANSLVSKDLGLIKSIRFVGKASNPVRVLKLFTKQNLVSVAFASSSMGWNMYVLLTPLRLILNPRLHLTTPLQSGLLYIAPGAGYLIGTLAGGRWADYFVKRWIEKRGSRLPEDRLRGSLPLLGVVLPGLMVLYGWTLDRRVGGIPLPVITMFFQGVAQTMTFPSLNTYILDAFQDKCAEASATHYLMRYSISSLATAVCLPLIQVIGIGWTSTLSAAIFLVSTVLVQFTIQVGQT